MQMANTHRIGPVAMDLRMDPPFQRNQPAGMLDDRPVNIVEKNILRPNSALFCAGAGADEALVSARYPDRDMAEHADHALLVQHSRQ